MSVLILNAGTASPIAVVVQSAGETAPIEIGSVTPSFFGADRSSVRAVKRTLGALTTYVDTATKDSIINLLKNGRQIPCSGDLLANIQTLCTMRYTGSKMLPQFVGLWEVGLTGNEVQPNNILLRYSPGDTITGEAFTRSTVGRYRNVGGMPVASAAINVKRDAHYALTDLIGNSPSLLLEDARTNIAVSPRDLTNAAWTKTNMTATQNQLGVDGAANAATALVATAANATCTQAVVLASSQRSMSAYVFRGVGSGPVQMTTDGGATWTNIALAGVGVYVRVSIPPQTVTNPNFGFRIVTNGDAIAVDFVLNETGPFVSSPIDSATTRGADLYSLPFTFPPGETSIYIKFIELGTVSTPNGTPLLIANVGSANPLFAIFAPGGFYTATHNNGTTGVSSSLAVAPAYGDTVELVARLYGDGSVDITQSINGGASTTSVQSAAIALATAWSGQLLWPNSSSGGVRGFMAVKSLKVVAGMRSLAEMRAA